MRGFRKQAFHDTAVMQKHAVLAEELVDFAEGDRVMTVDGFPGRVTAVLFGPYQGTESYQVELDGGMGGGDYAPGQLSNLRASTASREVEAVDYTASIPVEANTDHLANVDYPELEDILVVRQPIENLRMSAAVNTDKADTPEDVADDPGENADQQKLNNEEPDPHDDDNPDADPEVDEDDEEAGSQNYQVGDVKPPDACSFCGNASFGDPQMTGRGVRMRCDQCGGTMKSWGGQWEPEFPNSSQNHASETWDYRSGGPGGIGQAPGGQPFADNQNQEEKTNEADSNSDSKAAALKIFASMNRNELAESLQSEAGIVQYLFNKLYLKAREKEREQANEWWQPTPEQMHQYDEPYSGPAQYTGSLSEYDDPEWRWHVTAAWMDVQAKARKIRKESGVKIVSASNIFVNAEVRGDKATYETQLNYVPGTKKVADWACGCKWASYAWGRAKRYQRFEGRLCSHALATQYEANSRGIFGRDVKQDVQFPDWSKPHSPVVVQYDRGQGKDLTRRTVPPANMKRTFSSRLVDTDGIYPEPDLLDLSHAPIYASVQTMVDNQANLVDVIEMLASMDVDQDDARSMLFEVLADLNVVVDGKVEEEGDDSKSAIPTSSGSKQHKKHQPTRQEHGITYGYGLGPWAWCGLCGGSGCNNCNGTGQVPQDDDTAAGQGGAVDAGADASGGGDGGGATTASIKEADYSSADPLVGLDGGHNQRSSVPHSNSENPASTGWATSQDPGDWGKSLISNDFGITFDAALDSDGVSEAALDFQSRMMDATLNDEPEPALPSTTGDDGQGEDEMPDASAGNTVDGAHGEEPFDTTASIIAEFQRTAGGQALAKEAMKDFSFEEQQELINEGKGDRARNFNDLKIAGTHYELIGNDAPDDETILWI